MHRCLRLLILCSLVGCDEATAPAAPDAQPVLRSCTASQQATLRSSLQARLGARLSELAQQHQVTATRFSGEFLDQPFGTVTVGALADLVVTEGNPLVRIEDAAAVRQVMKGGEVFDIATLIAPFKDVAQAQARPVKALAARKGGQWWHEAAYVESGRAACCVDPFCAVQQNGRRRFVVTEV